MKTYENIGVAGHIYSVQVDDTNKITHIACQGRWAMQELKFIGLDDWTLDQLQGKVDLLCVGQKYFS
jgi:hypothetical protein